ncbi:4-phosphopantetheinyl transferase, partial [Francisella tularensis subsp. holarctica]|nr:4-phosphopantetheinyl transferase [Francisella tularensis subsp. holarctica]
MLDFEKYKAEDIRVYLCCRNNDAARFNNKQNIFSQFVRYVVLEEL